MEKVLYMQPDIVKVIYDFGMKTIIAHWDNLGPHNYVQLCTKAQLACVRQDKAKVIIMDTAKAKGVMNLTDQAWLGTYLFPELYKAGLRAVITVTPTEATTKLSTQRWNRTGQLSEISFVEVSSFEAAREIAKRYTG